MKKELKEILNDVWGKSRSSNEDSERREELTYKRKLAKTPDSVLLRIEYMFFLMYRKKSSYNYKEFLSHLNSIIKLIPTKTKPYDIIFQVFTKLVLNKQKIPSELEEDYIKTLVKICELNPPRNYKDELQLRESFSPEQLLIKLSLECTHYPETTISYYEHCISNDPSDLEENTILSLLYFQYNQYDKAAKIISSLNDLEKFPRMPASSNNHSYIYSILYGHNINKNKLGKTVQFAIKNFELKFKDTAFLTWLLVKFNVYDVAKKVYSGLIAQAEKYRAEHNLDFDTTNLASRLVHLKNRPYDPMNKVLNNKEKKLIKTYANQPASAQKQISETLKNIIKEFTEDQNFYEKVKKDSEFSRSISVETHNYIIELYFTKVKKQKAAPKDEIIGALGPVNFVTIKNPYIEKLKISAISQKKEAIKKLNKLLIRDLYWLKDLEIVNLRIKGIVHHICGLEYIHHRKTAEALSELKLAQHHYESSFICQDFIFILNLQELYFSNQEELKKIIKKIEPLVQLEKILKLKTLSLIKKELQNLPTDPFSQADSFPQLQINTEFREISNAIEAAIELLTDAFNFKKINFTSIGYRSSSLLNEGYIEIKKFLDSIINFCFKLQQYPNLEEANKDEQQLLEEFSEADNQFQNIVIKYLEKIDQKTTKTDNTATKIETQIKEPKPTEHFRYNYKIKIIRYANRKGLIEVHRGHQRIAIKTTEIQTDMLMIMAKNAKQRDKKKPDKDKGWTSVHNFIENVNAWSIESGTKKDQVRTQIKAIRKKLHKNTISEDFIETSNSSGYKISTHPDNITTEK